jgi:hypothetical protein
MRRLPHPPRDFALESFKIVLSKLPVPRSLVSEHSGGELDSA